MAYHVEDSSLVIRDLDTGKVISVSDYDTNPASGAQLPRSRSNSYSKPQIPSYIEFQTLLSQKKAPFFKNVQISQILPSHQGRVWCLSCSLDGQYIASGGEDGKICLYSVGSRLALVRTYTSHTSDITSLAFSSENLVLSSSLDQTVRLWHPSQDKELSTFKHDDAVTAITVHPTDSSIFVACTFGNSVLIWSIRTNEVLQTLEFVSPPTAAAFSPDGLTFAVGCFNGFCFIYTTPDFRYITQFIAGPRHKKQTANKKITSIDFVGNGQFFVATNDSRVRLYSKDNFSVIRKYVGHESTESQMRISVSSDHQLIMSPSENAAAVVIWPIDHQDYFKSGGIFGGFSRDRSKTFEGFRLGKHTAVNAAVFTKASTIEHLQIVVGDKQGNVYYVTSD